MQAVNTNAEHHGRTSAEGLKLQLVGINAKLNSAQLARTGYLIRASTYRAEAAAQTTFTNMQAHLRAGVKASMEAELLLREINGLLAERDDIQRRIDAESDVLIPLPRLSRDEVEGFDDMGGIMEGAAA